MTAVAVLENVTFVHGDKIQYVIIVFDDEYIYQVSQKILVFRYLTLCYQYSSQIYGRGLNWKHIKCDWQKYRIDVNLDLLHTQEQTQIVNFWKQILFLNFVVSLAFEIIFVYLHSPDSGGDIHTGGEVDGHHQHHQHHTCDPQQQQQELVHDEGHDHLGLI